MANEIFTRIQLKYDSWSNWSTVKDTFVPLKGEVCVVNPGEDSTSCLLKVGDGSKTFGALPWVSAPAADIAAWAKAADVRLKDQKLEFFTGDNIIKTVDLSTFATEAEVNALLAGYKKVQDPVADPTANGKSLTFIDTISQNAQGVITATKKNVNLDAYALKTEIPTELGVMSVNKTDGTAIEVNNTDKANPKIGLKINATAGDVTLTQSNDGLKANLNKAAAGLDKVENKSTETIKSEFTGAVADGNTGFVTGDAVHDAIATAVEELTVGAHVYDVKPAKETGGNITVTPTTEGNKTTFKVGLEVTEMLSGISTYTNRLNNTVWGGLYVNQDVSMEYDEASMTYTLYQNLNTEYDDSQEEWVRVAKQEIGKITIPKDMVVKSGTVVTKTEAGAWGDAGTYIALTLANATNDTIYINVGNLIEYVTSGSNAGDMVVVNVSDDHKVTATITDGTVTKAKLASAVQTSLGKADTAVQSVTTGTGNGTIKVDGTDVAVKGLGSAAYTESSAYATAAQGTKADSAIQNLIDLGPDYQDTTIALEFMDIGVANTLGAYAKLNDGAVTVAKLADDVKELIKTEAATLDAVVLSEAQQYTDDAMDGLHAIATSGSIYDVAEGHKTSTGTDVGAKYLIFNCGSATTVI